MHKNQTQRLSASLEDYLEAIYHISQQKQAAKAKDISLALSVNKSSVTGALKSLAGKGLINYAPYDLISLTPEGREVAQAIVSRHVVFRRFLVEILGIESGEAESNACRVEHALSGEILEKLRQFTDFIIENPSGRKDIIEAFRQYRKNEEKSR